MGKRRNETEKSLTAAFSFALMPWARILISKFIYFDLERRL